VQIDAIPESLVQPGRGVSALPEGISTLIDWIGMRQSRLFTRRQRIDHMRAIPTSRSEK
jgi:hypothetical protein